jgi:AP-3 complex subunit delta-1
MPDHIPSIQLCVQKLRIFIEDSDQNLKYLGLQAMASVLKIHPKAVAAHRDLILQCLDDTDESIRVRALDLVCFSTSLTPTFSYCYECVVIVPNLFFC